MKCVVLESNPKIIGWVYMEIGRVFILDNWFRGSLENFYSNIKMGGGGGLFPRLSMCSMTTW